MTAVRIPPVAAEVVAIRPGSPLTGSVTVDGSKNAALPLLAAQSAPTPAPQDTSDKEAMALLKKLEDRHVSAKTLHLKSKVEMNTGGQATAFQCELWFADGAFRSHRLENVISALASEMEDRDDQ